MKDNHLVVGIIIVALVFGVLFLAKLAFMGGLLFLAAWLLVTRIPGMKAIAQRLPVTMDIAMTVLIAWVAPGNGFQKMVAVSIAALMFTLWTAWVRVRYLAAKEQARGGVGAPQGA